MSCVIKRIRQRFYSQRGWIGIIACLVCISVSWDIEAQPHQTSESDMALPTDVQEIVEAGRGLFSEKCTACHGGQGRGGKAPCLSCGRFIRSGNTNTGIYTTISVGIPMTKMGAYATTLSGDEILSLVTYLRWQENQRREAGEIAPVNLNDDQPLEFPNSN